MISERIIVPAAAKIGKVPPSAGKSFAKLPKYSATAIQTRPVIRVPHALVRIGQRRDTDGSARSLKFGDKKKPYEISRPLKKRPGRRMRHPYTAPGFLIIRC